MKALQSHPLASFAALTLCLALASTACTELPRRSGIVDSLNQVSFEPPPVEPGAAASQATGAAVTGPTAPGAGNGGPAMAGTEIYGGGPRRSVAGGSGGGRTAQARAGEDGGVTLNFDRADIREAIRVVLGDVLGATYGVDPNVNGEVTLSSTDAIPRDDLLPVLESMLRGNGATLVEVAPNAYQVLPLENAPARAEVAPLGGRAPRLRPGFGITVVPLRNISASAAAQFIQPIVTSPEDIRIDAARNLLLFAGSGPERQSVVETLADLDVNWLADKAVGLFPLRVTTAEAVIPELQGIFGSLDPNTADAPLVRFVPVTRLNAILAVGTNAAQIEEVERWVARLDRGRTVGTQFYVYNLKFAAAEDVAKLLNEIYSDAPGGGAGDLGAAPAPAGPASLAPVGATQAAAPGAGDEGAIKNAGGGDAGAQAAPAVSAPGAGRNPLGIKVVANRPNNSLLIRATPQVYEQIEATLARIDTAPAQVLIEASIVEVLLNDALRYGVQYFIKQNGVRFGFYRDSVPNQNGRFGIEPLPTIPGLNLIATGGQSNITIDALARLTDVKVLSSPSLVVQDNREATLTVGDEVPITTRQAQSVVDPQAPFLNSIEYRNTGVILQVRPRININGVVALEIAQEVSRVAEQAAGAQGDLTPTITQRKITSRVSVQNGQTVVLGGLIEDSEQRSRDRIPILGEIPVVGGLFGTTNTSDRRTELIVFITPRVIRDAEDARDVSEELRARLKALRPLTREAALPPVPLPPRERDPFVPGPPPSTGPRPVVPPGTLGRAAPPASSSPAGLAPEEARAARAQGVPEAWLPELVGAAPRATRATLRRDEEEGEEEGGDAGAAAERVAEPEPGPEPELEPAAAPIPAEAPRPGEQAAAAQTMLAAAPGAKPGFDIARAPVPRARPVSRVPEPPPLRPRPFAED